MKDDRVIYLQATYMLETAQTMEREYAPLLTIGDNYEKYVVSMDEVQFPSNEGVRHIQALEFKGNIVGNQFLFLIYSFW